VIPPLRERREDIHQLVLHFIEVFSRRMGKRIDDVPQATLDAFTSYDWPGNVRELQNLVERAVIRSDEGVLQNPLPITQRSRTSVLKFGSDLLSIDGSDTRIGPGVFTETKANDSLEEIQRRHILSVLEKTDWVISGLNGAGEILKIHPNTLRSLMNRLGIRRTTQPI